MKQKMRNKSESSKITFIILFLVIFSPVISLASISSTVNLGNIGNSTNSSSIQNQYSILDNLKGTINISLASEPSDSLISLIKGTSTISSSALINLLDKNSLVQSVSYQCNPSNCLYAYTAQDSGSSTKSFSLNSGESKIVGLKLLTSNVYGINNFSMNITSSASASCSSQLSLELPSEYYGAYNTSLGKRSNPPSYCSDENYGCFSSSDANSIPIQSTTEYCSTIYVSSAAALQVGSDVTGSGAATFDFKINGDETNKCTASTNAGGKLGCIINFTVDQPQNISVCMNKKSGSSYNILFEDASPVCGSVEETVGDFSIYAKPVAYSAFGELILISSQNFNFENVIKNYIQDTYNNNCSSGCFVPIKFYSNKDQVITINSAKIIYNTLTQTSTALYNLEKSTPKITMPFTVLSLNNLNLTVPSTSGNNTVTLKIGDKEIFTKIIVVSSESSSFDIYPKTIPAGVNFKIRAISTYVNATSYRWNFGDNTSLDTNVPYVNHIYGEIKNYNLNVLVQTSSGSINKTFTVSVVSPKDYINSTISSYKAQIESLNSQINSLPSVIKSSLTSALNLTSNSDALTSLGLQYNNAGNSAQAYITIANSLNSITLPSQINITRVASGKFIIDSNKINLQDLESVSGEQYTEEIGKVRNAIFAWFLSNIDASINFRVYSGMYGETTVPLVSYINLKIIPKNYIENIFIFVGSLSSEIAGTSNVKTTASGKSFSISSLAQGSQKDIEIAISGLVDVNDIPLYIFPSKSELNLIDNIAVCNYNEICESSRGETNSNCSYDCKPWKKIYTGWIVVVVIFFILYIIAQEWYKRNYEKSLFKNSNDLYNVINFMDNATKQGLSKGDIYSKLKANSWSPEQIDYAYRKYHGMRTGMLEIPIFRFFEKRRVQSEIDSRKNQAKPNIPVNKPINNQNFNNFGTRKL